MKNRLFFTAGPSQSYPTVASHVQDALKRDILSISHRGGEFQVIFNNVRNGLKRLLDIPEEYEIFFFSSATEIWERLIQNCVQETSFHFDNGAFGNRFYQTAKQLKKKALRYNVSDGESFNYGSVLIPHETELIGFTHNESSTGVMLDFEDMYAVKKQRPDALVAVDVVSSIPYPVIDFSRLDAVFFSVQKGFGLPAGLGVCILSPAALKKAAQLTEKGANVGSYHSFAELKAYADKAQTPETPNVLNLYLLWRIIEDFEKKGLQTIRTEIDEKADMLYRFFYTHHSWKPFVKQEQHRSRTLAVIETGEDTKRIITTLAKDNIEIGAGYGTYKDTHIRIANFPSHTIADMEKLIDKLEKLG